MTYDREAAIFKVTVISTKFPFMSTRNAKKAEML